MPHELEIRDGTASFVSARQVPWHRLGQILDRPMTVEEALELSRADYEVWKEPIYVLQPSGDYTAVEGQVATVRSHPAREGVLQTLGIVGEDYGVVQNREAFSFLDELPRLHPEIVTPETPLIETMGVLFDGRRAFASLKLPREIMVAGEEDRVDLYVAIVTSHDGRLALTGAVTPIRLVCHEEGTMMDDHGWRGKVEEHFSATRAQLRPGRRIKIWGLPFTEGVTEEHLYWAREVSKRNPHRGPTIVTKGEPRWTEARDLKFMPSRGNSKLTYHEIGFPIDMVEEPAPSIEVGRFVRSGWGKGGDWLWSIERNSRLDDPEWWWAIGYWWGNGNIGYDNRSKEERGLTFSVPDEYSTILDRLVKHLRANGWQGNPTQRDGCKQLTFYDRTLATWLANWSHDDDYWSHKVPSTWVEKLPLDLQRQLVKGYFDADGDKKTHDGAIISSVCLDGLLSLRRILMRLGVPSSIRLGSKQSGKSRIQDRSVMVQRSYTIRFWKNIEQLGLTSRHRGYVIPYIEDGVLWSRVKSVEEVEQLKVWPITTETSDYLTAFGRSHNCHNTVTAGLRKAVRTWKVNHTSHIKGRMQEARKTLDLTYRYADEFETVGRELAATRMTLDAQAKALSSLWPVAEDAAARSRQNHKDRIDQVLGLTSADPTAGTAWGLWNGVVEYIDFWQITRARSGDQEKAKKAKAASLSWGKLADEKARAFSVIRELVKS